MRDKTYVHGRSGKLRPLLHLWHRRRAQLVEVAWRAPVAARVREMPASCLADTTYILGQAAQGGR